MIKEALGGRESRAGSVAGNEAVERETAVDVARFFRDSVDYRRHSKEEEQLLVAVVSAGLPHHQEPIAVMLAAHDEGREHVCALRTLGVGDGPLSEEERKLLVMHVSEFVFLLRDHIGKENNVLYPMAEARLSSGALADLAEKLEALDREAMGKGEQAGPQVVADELVAAYPLLERTAVATDCPHSTDPFC